MSDEMWSGALQLLRSKLREIGRPDIVDLSNYDRGEGLDRRLPNERTLVLEMLKALRNEMRARSPELRNYSLKKIQTIVKGENFPTKVTVYRDAEYGEGDRYDIPPEDEKVTKAILDLSNLIGYLEEHKG